MRTSAGVVSVLLAVAVLLASRRGGMSRPPPAAVMVGPQFGLRATDSENAHARSAAGRPRRVRPSSTYDFAASKAVQKASSDPTSMFDMSTP